MKYLKYVLTIVASLGLIVLYQNSTTTQTYKILVTQTSSSLKVDFKTDTLAKAFAHIQSSIANNYYARIDIVINSGTYLNEALVLNDLNLKAPTTIKALSLNAKPNFVGQGNFMFLKVAPTKNLYPVHIQGLKIQKYNTAIQFITEGANAYQGLIIAKGHRLEDSELIDIGNEKAQTDKPSYSAVTLQNVQNSVVLRNKFINIVSHDVVENGVRRSGALQHALYIAHFSSGNRIAYNEFINTKGDWIRIRNRSHNNVIEFNSWKDEPGTKVYGISTWFDAADTRPANLECPSFGNQVQYNNFTNTGQWFEHQLASAALPGCPAPPAAPVFTASKNLNTTVGRCEIFGLQDCSGFMIKSNTPQLDYSNQPAQDSGSVCANRPLAYYNSCSKRSFNMFEVYRSRFESATVASNTFSGRGCVIDVENCARMAKPDFIAFMDSVPNGYADEAYCKSRSLSWYKSCATKDAAGSRFARSVFVRDNYVKEAITGHGCLVRVNFCPRMGFEQGQVKVDQNANAQLSKSACMARATTWMNSCKADNIKIPRKIEMLYFQNGSLIQSKVLQ